MAILGDDKGELKDHLVKVTDDDLLDPDSNICAGIRWLFRKKDTASSRLGRQATWEEGVEDYKSYLTDIISGRDLHEGAMGRFRDFYRQLKEK